MRTANPALNDKTFEGLAGQATADEAMTIQGTVNKTLLLLACVLLTAGWNWNIYFRTQDPASVAPWIMVGTFGGFILALITMFKQSWAPVTSPIYALLEGLFIGGISSVAESQYPGIVVQTVGLTFGTCLALLVAYKTGFIRASENFKLGVVAATGGMALVYLASIILSLFRINVPFIFGNGLIGIGFSILVVTIAALNLVLDFDFIEASSRQRLPRFMEWYAAFGLMVTLIWLYIEILRLLMKLRNRD